MDNYCSVNKQKFIVIVIVIIIIIITITVTIKVRLSAACQKFDFFHFIISGC